MTTTTPQTPLGSGFGPASTATDVLTGIDLTGELAIVTGGGSGLGVEAVRALRAANADVIVPARDPDRAAAALAGIDGVDIRAMELMDPASIDSFAEGVLADDRSIDVQINSAGIMAAPLVRDSRGYESHFSTNHLGHFQLTARLWPLLARDGGARVVSVSSWGHRRSDIVWDDPNFEHTEYEPLLGYGQSKTANILFAVELDRLGREHGVRAFSVHPGGIVTPLARYTSDERLRAMGVLDENGAPILDPSRNLKTPEQGAATAIWCATSPQLDGLGGVYCENVDISPISTVPRDATPLDSGSHGVMPYAADPDAARRLWTLSTELTGVHFPAQAVEAPR
ncbi:oxidoreductase [Saccharopolyspora sp. K220]|uniref:oxidoreductase n=1 Tax=Saccharopolyspora soli TaxID=2926618 RepID=UPI001F5775B8|nr:oxidoreductase [Saccharopolyspora soli]MCI2423370.1 oxidoreductase [Saccharopolyspora soli]